MIDAKAFKAAFGTPLVDDGYKRKGQNWHKDAGDLKLIINLQKSEYANDYYINLAFNFKELTGQAVVPEHKCHIRLRADDRFTDSPSQLRDLMSPDYSGLDAKEHAEGIRRVSEKLAQFMLDLSSVEQLSAAYYRGDLEGAAVRKAVRPLLGASSAAK